MNIKRLVSGVVNIKGVGFSHVSDAFGRGDYNEFIDVVKEKLSSAEWADGETEFDLKFKGDNFSISAYLQGLTISVAVKFLDDRFMFLSASVFVCKLGILETSGTEELYTMFTERAVEG